MSTDVNISALLRADSEVNNFDWLDLSLLGSMTDKQKWSIIIQTDPIDQGPFDKEERFLNLKRFLFAYGLTEEDFTLDGVLKKDNTL